MIDTITIYLSFFFSCSGDHRDLHSFPTRRSSDLSGRQADRLPRRARRLQPQRRDIRDERRWVGAAQPHPQPRPDRKSTRLNSSHVEISYAVFCLKKKKKKCKENRHEKT